MSLDLREVQLSVITELEHQPPLMVQIDRVTMLCLIGHLQLALRHPDNQGESSKKVRAFIDQIRRHMAEPGSPLDTLIRMGDDPQFDVERG